MRNYNNVMKLFHPSHFPICHDGGVTSIPITEFDEIEPGIFRRKNCKDLFSLHDAMKTSMRHSTELLLSNYSIWTYFAQIESTVGNITRIEIPLPSGYAIYSVPLPTAMMGDVNEGEHCFPSLFHIDKNSILIGTTAHQVASNPIGKKFALQITAHCYQSTDAPGWKKVLYSGLSNLSQGNTNVSVLLLATAVELYADHLFGKYLEQKSVEETIRTRVVDSVRPWPLKAKRISDVLEILLPAYDQGTFDSGLKAYNTKVRKKRNKYAHEHSEDISKPDAHDAFIAAYDLLWYFDQLDVLLQGH